MRNTTSVFAHGLLALALATSFGARSFADHVPATHAHHHHCDMSEPPMAAQQPLPGTSLYQIDAAWTTQAGAPFHLGDLRGHPTLVLMFYGTCHAACPVLLNDMRRIDAALDPATRASVRVVLITFDPAEDSPDALRELAEHEHFDLSRWVLLHGSDMDTRTVATALGVQYARTAEGAITHSNQITLLDRDGAPSFTLEGLGQPVDEIARRAAQLAR